MKVTIENIISIMRVKYSLDISCYEESFLEKTVNYRVAESQCGTIDKYIAFLRSNPSESDLLSDSLNNYYSEFFRNPLTFLIIEQIVFPKLFSEKSSHSEEIRIWSAGCSAGQEPYSLAILADDYRSINQKNVSVRIFATDKSERELQSARKGIYHLRSVQNAKLQYVNKYFSNSGEFYSINANIRDLIDFSLLDLLEESGGAPPASIYGDFDVIMCSNLLFYYKPEIQKRILTRLCNSLVDGGFLITSEAEVGIVKTFRKFKQYAAPAAIFIRQ